MAIIDNLLEYNEDRTVLLSLVDKDIKKATMLDSCVKIKNKAFLNSRIEDLTFSKNLEIIQDAAFEGSCIRNLSISQKIKIEYGAFYNCTYLNKVDINCEDIPMYCFKYCNGNYIDFDLKNTRIIREEAFYRTNINKLVLPDTLEIIGKHTFAKSNLKDLYLPKSIKHLSPTIVTNEKLTVHVYEETYEKLNEFFKESGRIKIITLNELLQQHTFKEINKDKLNKKEIASIYR